MQIYKDMFLIDKGVALSNLGERSTRQIPRRGSAWLNAPSSPLNVEAATRIQYYLFLM